MGDSNSISHLRLLQRRKIMAPIFEVFCKLYSLFLIVIVVYKVYHNITKKHMNLNFLWRIGVVYTALGAIFGFLQIGDLLFNSIMRKSITGSEFAIQVVLFLAIGYLTVAEYIVVEVLISIEKERRRNEEKKGQKKPCIKGKR